MSPIVRANFEVVDAIRGGDFKVDSIPDTCPICHQGIEPIRRFGWLEEGNLSLIYQCPKKECRLLFIARYFEPSIVGVPSLETIYRLRAIEPWRGKRINFPQEIMKISVKFCKIYNQAREAEARGLKEICGAGYRRALEFLIKDYLKKEGTEKPDIIEKTPLGDCIKTIKSAELKDCAKRAAWLGNDETHYIRIWKGKDLEDLKNLIQLTVNWIHNEHLTRKIKEDMPDKKTRK